MDKVEKTPKKKHFRCYESYIPKILKNLSKSNNITSNAKQQLNSVLTTLSQIITRNSVKLAQSAGKRTLSDKEVENAFRILLNGELQKHALSEGNKAVNSFVNKENGGKSRQSRSGIIFPPSLTEKFLRENSRMLVTQNAPIFMAGAMEYLCMEILDSATTQTSEDRRVRLTVRDLELAVKSDKELNNIFIKNRIEFMGGGVIPYIHPTFLISKRKKRASLGKEKLHRYRPGTVALREIKKQQKAGNKLILAKKPFEKLIRSIAEEYKSDIKISSGVFRILQYWIEQYIVNIFSKAVMVSLHSHRIKVIPTDIDLVVSLLDTKKNISEIVLGKINEEEEERERMGEEDEEYEEEEEEEDEEESEESEGEESEGEESGEDEESEGEESGEDEESEGEN